MKKILSRKSISLLLVMLLAFAMTSCSEPEPEEPAGPLPADYFPMTLGSTWDYLGEGNEYAAFTREVIFVEGNKAQFKDSNGGTISALVFETTPDAVTRVFFQGEEYGNDNFLEEASNDDTILLKAPLAVGTQWTDGDETREILDLGYSVSTPIGVFEDCIQIGITSPTATMYEYYKEGVGLVRREFLTGDEIISSTLQAYDIQ